MLPLDRTPKEPLPQEIEWLLPLLNEPVFKVVGTGSITFVYQERPYVELDHEKKHLAQCYMVLPTRVQNYLYFIYYPFGGILEISDLTATRQENFSTIDINIAILNPSGFKATVCQTIKLTSSDITNILFTYTALPKDIFLTSRELSKLLNSAKESEEQKQT